MGNDRPLHGTSVVILLHTIGRQRTAECDRERMPQLQSIERRIDALQAPLQDEQPKVSNHDAGLRFKRCVPPFLMGTPWQGCHVDVVVQVDCDRMMTTTSLGPRVAWR